MPHPADTFVNPMVCVCESPSLTGWLMCRECKRKPAHLLGVIPGDKKAAS